MPPPDHKSERAVLADSPVSQKSLPSTADSTETVPELQAQTLRLFTRVRDMAIKAAQLFAWGGPR